MPVAAPGSLPRNSGVLFGLGVVLVMFVRARVLYKAVERVRMDNMVMSVLGPIIVGTMAV